MSLVKKVIGAITDGIIAAELKAKYVTAIIVAGGSGTRMGVSPSNTVESGAAQPYPATKQFLPVCGIPAVARTLMAFDRNEYIDEIVLAAKEEELPYYSALLAQFPLHKPFLAVAGGDTRQRSVENAFLAANKKADMVAIHDAARCLITPEQITKVCATALRHKAAAAACPARDTVKIVDGRNTVESTPDRDTLWQVQTPQVFDINVYSAALHFVKQDNIAVTDDCMMAEHIGIMPRLVDCGYENIKLTVPSDLLFAEAIIRERERAAEAEKTAQ